MCNPMLIALAGVAVSAAGAGYSAYAQGEAADDQKEAAEAQLQLQQDAIDKQNAQLSAQTAEEMSDNARLARREQAALRVSSGEAGVGGLSVQSLLDDVNAQTGFDNARAQKNLDNQIDKNTLDLQGFQLNANTKIQSANNRRNDALIGSGLQIANAGVSAYSTYQAGQTSKEVA